MGDRSLLVRALWFLAVGWWATPVVVNLAWALMATVVLAPFGVKLINRVPTVLTLREPRAIVDPGYTGGSRRSLPVRVVYFVLVGWWLSLLWSNLAAVLAVTVVGLPLAIPMFHRLPYVTSLYRFDG